MSSSPTVVVKKGGVLTALVSGVFGTLIVSIVCGVGVGAYALNIADRKVSDVLGMGQSLFDTLPEWRESLPTGVAEMLDDHRVPGYREELDATVRVVPRRPGERRGCTVISVTNRGEAVVTYMTARVLLSDEDDVPTHEFRTFIATPITIDEDEWRGPIQPGATRRYTLPLRDSDAPVHATLEITDVRVWQAESDAGAAERDVAANPES